MRATLAELASLVGGTAAGEGNLPLTGAATLRDARHGEITLVDRPEKLYRLPQSAASAVVVPRGLAGVLLPAIEVEDVHRAFSQIILHFRPARAASRRGMSAAAHVSSLARLANDVDVHDGVTIADDVSIGSGTTIHAGVHIMCGCRIGTGVTVFPGAVLYEGTIVGDRVLIHAGAVLGSYGFGYVQVEGRHQLSAQLGWVEIGDDVEIGAGSTIDRGTYGPTTIGAGTKIDNQVQIAHNCRLGRHNLICSQVGIAGSTTTGDYVVMGGQAGVRDHVHVGDRAVLSAMAGITNDVPAGECMMGIPATPVREQRIKQAVWTKLPEMRKQLKELERAVHELRERLGLESDREAA